MLAPGRNNLGRVLSSQPCAEPAAYLQGHLQAGLKELLSRARPQAQQGAREQAPASAQQKRMGSQRKYQRRQVLPQGNCTSGERPKESSTLLPPAGFPGSGGKGREGGSQRGQETQCLSGTLPRRLHHQRTGAAFGWCCEGTCTSFSTSSSAETTHLMC